MVYNPYSTGTPALGRCALATESKRTTAAGRRQPLVAKKPELSELSRCNQWLAMGTRPKSP